MLSFSPRGFYETLGQQPPAHVQTYFLSMWAGHAESLIHVIHFQKQY